MQISARSVVALVAGFLLHGALGNAQAGPFADKNLEAAVRAVLFEPKAELTDEKLNNVYILEPSGKDILSLAGLEKCKNLSLLKASKNQIVDLAPLRELVNLQSLDLSGNKITDITPLAGLSKLQYLELAHNHVAKIDALKGLTSLSALYVSGNQIRDISPLAGLSRLSSLSLDHNQIKDIEALAKITRLSTLNLNDNQVENLTPLAAQTELSLLMFENNRVADLTPLVNMCKADVEGQQRFAPFLRVYLKGNPLAEAARSKELDALKGYGVRIFGRDALGSGTPREDIYEFVPGAKEDVYEYRSGRLVKGTLLENGTFVPELGGKVIDFKDYHYAKDAPRIYNLPGRFVKKGSTEDKR
jgi:internalin A